MTGEELKDLIYRGEGESLDLTREFSKRVRDELHSRLAALANSKGGYLIFAVDSDKRVVGCRLSDNERAQVSQHVKHCKPVVRLDMMDINVDGSEVTIVLVPKSTYLHADKDFGFPQRVGDSYAFMNIHDIIAALQERGFSIERGPAADFIDLLGPPLFQRKERGAVEPDELEDLQQLLNSPFPNARDRGFSQLERLAYLKRVEDSQQILELLANTIAQDHVDLGRRAIGVFYAILANTDSTTKERFIQ